MIPFRVQTLFFYALPILYFYLVKIKHYGDIHHGATVMAWAEVQVLAVVILVGAWFMSQQVNRIEKGVLVLCVIYPLFGLGHEVWAALHG